MHLVVAADEIVAAVVVRDRVARRDDLIGVRAEYRAERFHVIGLGCGDQRAPGSFGRWKHLLLDVVGRGEGHEQKQADRERGDTGQPFRTDAGDIVNVDESEHGNCLFRF